MTANQIKNLRAAFAAFVREHLPVADPYRDNMTDLAWAIADRLESGLIYELEQIEASHPADRGDTP